MEFAIYNLWPIFVLVLLFDPLIVPNNRSKKDCKKVFLCVKSKRCVRISDKHVLNILADCCFRRGIKSKPNLLVAGIETYLRCNYPRFKG